MRRREPTTTRLPSTNQIMMASEYAILAALDVNLELAIRSLKAEHAGMALDDHLPADLDYEPYSFLLLPIAETLVLSARNLRKLVATYRNVADGLLTDRNVASEPFDVEPVTDEDSLF